ncbi:hypothetical protein [Litorimonas sp.]|uniref:hypothetical protein n=1 Tax=Litorimonas sp. TaxID=1892381 RepID=UPI003A8905B3
MKTHRLKELSLGGDMCDTLCGKFVDVERATRNQSKVTCGTCESVWQKKYNRSRYPAKHLSPCTTKNPITP